MERRPGSLVKVRDRDWVVLPSPDQELLLIKPLGGTEEETSGIYLPLKLPGDEIKDAYFPEPNEDDIGSLSSAKLLYNAARLSFRNGAGPFRCLAKLSFKPRSYQMVPLIMAMKLEIVRLLIADDVGVGKTIEALLIVKEMLERREIRRFAVVCLPHLCDQWQAEIKEKFDIDAVIIRNNTESRLDREIYGDISVYEYYPYQIISIDYIKGDKRRQVFIEQCPEMIIVDEAHTCARPLGAQKSQQQRYHLLHDIAKKKNQHLMLLTATPHSGKSEEFQSLLGLLKSKFEGYDIAKNTPEQNKELAQHFVQRKRADVEVWIDEETLFPKRDAGEFGYQLSPQYSLLFNRMLDASQDFMQAENLPEGQKRLHYWAVLGLLRGVMSSPAAGYEMLRNRMEKIDDQIEEIDIDAAGSAVMDADYGFDGDVTPTHLMSQAQFSDHRKRILREFAKECNSLQSITYDWKAAHVKDIIIKWVTDGYHPVIFCRYIATANYLGDILKKELKSKIKNLDIQVITSEEPDELRKQRIDDMKTSKVRVLVATDCLSEGINLQESFTAVLHYDLPWNPNRLEQREGRVDRFGQKSPDVKAYLLYGKDNPIDGVVLDVLIRKVREIKRNLKINMPFPDDSKNIMDTIIKSVLLNKSAREKQFQVAIDFGDNSDVYSQKVQITKSLDEAAGREKKSRSIFAKNNIKAQEIDKDLKESDEAIGSTFDVEQFVTQSLESSMGVQLKKDNKGYKVFTAHLPRHLKSLLSQEPEIKITFDSPVPDGYSYLGRNTRFVEQLCQHIMSGTLTHERHGASRAAVIKCKEVSIKTVIMMFRVRSLIQEKSGDNQLVAEEMLLWGYKGDPNQNQFILHKEADELLDSARPAENIAPEAREAFLNNELTHLEVLKPDFDAVAYERAEHLVEAHERFRKVLGGSKYKVVTPVLPMDILGLYILLPV